MYKNVYYDRNKNFIYLWDDVKGFRKFPFQKYAYKKDPNGSMQAIDGTPVKKVHSWTNNELDSGIIYEADLHPVTRTIIDMYYESDDVPTNHKYLFLDIEVSTETHVSEASDATNEITSIAYYVDNQYTVLLLDKANAVRPEITSEYKLYTYSDEKSLLLSFINQLRQIEPTIVIGWNSLYYDIPYICNRVKNILGVSRLNQLSPIGIVEYKEREDEWVIAGISHFDLMKLYKQFNQNELPSYALEFVSQTELGRGKIKYDGTLDDLRRTDIKKFIKYNYTDVELMVSLEKKLQFIELAIMICHKGHVSYDNIYQTSRYLDGASLTFTKRLGIVAPSKKKYKRLVLQRDHSEGEKKIFLEENIPDKIPKSGTLKIKKTATSMFNVDFVDYKDNYFILEEGLPEDVDIDYELHLDLIGGFVKQPKSGRYEWVYDLDLQSLYPSIMMTLNISPETKMGKVLNWDSFKFVSDTEEKWKVQHKNKTLNFNTSELKEFLQNNKYSVAANGVFYKTDSQGLIPRILEVWFDERVEYKNLRKKADTAGDTEKYNYYHLRQMVAKVMQNAFYGVLGLQSFRYHDISNAEAITSTGQQVIKFTERIANHYYNNLIGSNDVEYCVYTDTDSVDGSSLLNTNIYGNISIQDLFDKLKKNSEYISDISKREFVFPTELKLPYYDESEKKVKYGFVEYLEKHKVKKRKYKITLDNQKTLIVTEDHSIMVLENGKLVEKKPNELKKTDKIISIKA